MFKHIRRMSHYARSDSQGSDREWRPNTDDGSQGRSHSVQDGDNPDGGPKPKPISDLGEDIRVSASEMSWKYVGTGVYSRTFPNANKLITTTKTGPCMDDVHTRTVRDAKTGAIIDECIVEDTPDDVMHRKLPRPRDIRVELTMRKARPMFEAKGADIAEVYSPPRIAQEAAMKSYHGVRLHPGWSLDLTRNDPATNKPWDFSLQSCRDRAMALVKTSKPFMLIGSPPCTAFSAIQNMNAGRRPPEIIAKEIAAGRQHLQFAMKLYAEQAMNGRYFLHEHPHTASSWALKEVLDLALAPSVDTVVTHMCRFGMTSRDKEGPGLVKKPTRFMSNSPEVIKVLDRKCTNSGQCKEEHHRHVILMEGRAKACQEYPKALCQAVCDGVAAQKLKDKSTIRAMMPFDIEEMDNIASAAAEEGDVCLSSFEHPADALHEPDPEIIAEDDVSGEKLEATLVRDARKEEIAYFKSMGVYRKVPISKCYEATGRRPIDVRWIDINKGDSKSPKYRSRLVAKEFNDSVRPDLFAATPPVEGLRLLMSRIATGKKHRRLLYADVSRAYFYAPAVRSVFVRLPDEDRTEADSGMVGELCMSMYGTRDAAQNWAEEYSKCLVEAGFIRGVANPCLFRHAKKDVQIVVHGDDFMAAGEDRDLKEVEDMLARKYKITADVLGPDLGKGQKQELKILNRIIRWRPDGLRLEADPRHAEMVIEHYGLGEGKPVKTAGVKDPKKDVEEDSHKETDKDQPMSPAEAREHRGIAARLNYMTVDRADCQYATKELARTMACPTKGDSDKGKRIARYLLGRPRAALTFLWQEEVSEIAIYSDSDWAGCVKTRKSTSGGVLMWGAHTLKTYSRQQRTIALSSAEAELYALVSASAEGLGMQAYAKDLGIYLKPSVFTDASAALGIAQRRGIGKLRHVDTQALWVQQAHAAKTIAFTKVPGEVNPADMLTKHVPSELLDRHMARVGLGRKEAEPPTHPSSEHWKDQGGCMSQELKGEIPIRQRPRERHCTFAPETERV